MTAHSREIRPAYPHEVAAFFGERTEWVAALIDGEAVALGGVYHENGRAWGHVEIRDGARRMGARIVLALFKALLDRNEDIYTQCDEASHPGAPRLLRLLGFETTDETRNGLRVWIWHSCRLCCR